MSSPERRVSRDIETLRELIIKCYRCSIRAHLKGDLQGNSAYYPLLVHVALIFKLFLDVGLDHVQDHTPEGGIDV